MKAIVLVKYGSPVELEFKEVETPNPQDDEVKVKIVSASVNATDFEIMRGNFFVRISRGLRNPRNITLGCDFAGRVESVGKNVTQFKSGDEVHADLMYQKPSYGAFAEYVCIPEKRLRMKPATMTFDEASTIPQAGVLALQGIKGKTPPTPGQEVLINGAGGGVGTFAIQIAKYYGAEVTAVDNAIKFEMMQSLGADHVIDYTQEDFTKNNKQYDLILDVIARKSVNAYRRSLNPNGSYRMVGGTTRRIFGTLIFGSLLSLISSKKIGLMMGRPNDKEDMEFLTELFEAKKVIPVIDKKYSLNGVPEAIKYLEDGHAIGKIIISME
ncbi:MAG: NAD(P)-dependent alcohol dehydrogenase [Candidatus Heimdallarchaeota archaeon]|nr:NAD(P)-dependent alcohol dehydrogenase [Candidatus Heimdallarchaeota archaeon]